MPRRRKSKELLSRSTSRSPLASPGEETPDPIEGLSSVAFVPFDVGSSSGISSETRKAVRIQAAKASAAARKRTIARKIALQNSAVEESLANAAPESNLGRGLSASSSLQTDTTGTPASQTTKPVRTRSAGQLEPFTPFPVSQWHPDIPALVGHFLNYFAPENSTGVSRRDALRRTIWPKALNHGALFHALMLNAGSHASISGALTVPIELLSQLKHSTIENVNDAIARPEAGGTIGDYVMGAIALLGGWELEYGSSATYDTHMRGLKTIVNLRGGLYSAQSSHIENGAISPDIMDLILAAGHDLARRASKTPYFGDVHDSSPIAQHSAIPTGFASLILQRLISSRLVDLVSKIAHIVAIDDEILLELGGIEEALENWKLDNDMKASYSPFLTTSEESLQRQISSHVCLAGQVVCTYLRVTTGSINQDYLEALHESASNLSSQIMIGTVYEEVTLWALFIICCLIGRYERSHMQVLKKLCLELDINDWFACRQALGRYAYSSAILDGRAYALWEALDSVTIELSRGDREPTRFAKGIRHPTTYIGRAIVAEEG